MKKVFFAVAAMAILYACDSTTVAGVNEENNSAATVEKNAENMRTVYRAIETGDVQALDTLLADNVVDHNGGMNGEDVVGRDSVKALISQIHQYFDGLKMELLRYGSSPDGEYFYATVRMTGTARQNPWGMPAGMKMDDTSVDVIRLKDGKATDHWAYMSMQDVHEMMQASSAGQAPPKDTTQKN